MTDDDLVLALCAATNCRPSEAKHALRFLRGGYTPDAEREITELRRMVKDAWHSGYFAGKRGEGMPLWEGTSFFERTVMQT